MTTLLTIVHIAVCFFLVVIVLLQQGKGANMGATFGGSSQTVFGTEGPLPLLNKVTTFAAITFMVTSITLAYISAHRSTSSVMQDFSVQKPQENAIERSPETLPQQPMPDMPLAPADAQPKSDAAAPVTGGGQAAVEKAAEGVAPPAAEEKKQDEASTPEKAVGEPEKK